MLAAVQSPPYARVHAAEWPMGLSSDPTLCGVRIGPTTSLSWQKVDQKVTCRKCCRLLIDRMFTAKTTQERQQAARL